MAIVLMTVASCSRGAMRPVQRGSGSTGSWSTIVTAPSTTLPVHDGLPHFAIGTVIRDFVDAKRGRTLRTILYYPAKGQPGQPGSDPADGAFPLVLMAHGYRLPVGGYERILGRVTSAGYIVAAPAFPHTNADTGDGNRSDIVNQPADLSFVVDAVTDLAKKQPRLLPPVADPTRVAALGHSDGGITVSAWAYDNSSRDLRDRRAAAVVEMAGGIGLYPGTYFAPDAPPILVIHATADEINPYSASVNLFNAVPAGIPHFLLTINGGSHLGPYMYDTAMPEVGQVIVDFLDGYFLGHADARQRLIIDANHPGATSLRSS